MGWNDDTEYESDQDNMLPCPHCRAEIYDEAEQCPYCGEFILSDARPFASKPTWVQWLFVLIVAVIIWAMAFPFFW